MHPSALDMTGYLALFWRADVVVKSVMSGLLLASLLSWAIIIEKTVSLAWSARADRRFIRRYRAGTTEEVTKSTAARLFHEMSAEAGGLAWTPLLRDCVEARLRLFLSQIQRQRRAGLPFLATLASSGPFVGLFGTVWGIMASFTAIAESQNTSLAVVAPGIAEALLATGVGLFAAIPAAVFYNRLTVGVNISVAMLDELGQEIMIRLMREMAGGPRV
ncbi:MotA/TolQ/ExbB proton channel family protein [Aestuariivirga sp.]|uniref:MotA/TolQ/ExbB proton channel family protein n=1 Tax=Aestuariivirga sp. TaxID=2650926 RepID=UPI003BA900C1